MERKYRSKTQNVKVNLKHSVRFMASFEWKIQSLKAVVYPWMKKFFQVPGNEAMKADDCYFKN